MKRYNAPLSVLAKVTGAGAKFAARVLAALNACMDAVKKLATDAGVGGKDALFHHPKELLLSLLGALWQDAHADISFEDGDRVAGERGVQAAVKTRRSRTAASVIISMSQPTALLVSPYTLKEERLMQDDVKANRVFPARRPLRRLAFPPWHAFFFPQVKIHGGNNAVEEHIRMHLFIFPKDSDIEDDATQPVDEDVRVKYFAPPQGDESEPAYVVSAAAAIAAHARKRARSEKEEGP